MDTYENEYQGAEPEQELPEAEPVQPQQETVEAVQPEMPAESARPSKKRSPFADSPYERNTNAFSRESKPSEEARPVRKGSGKLWLAIGAVTLALAVAVGSGAAAVGAMNLKMNRQMDALAESYDQKIQALEAQISEMEKPSVMQPGTVVPTDTGAYTPAQVYAQNVQSVVAITSQVSTGSGFIISEDGYIVSNHHVVNGATSLMVTTHDGMQYQAELIGSDSTNDVALLKVQTTGLRAVAIGKSSDLIVGDQVVAIGNPLGELTATMTVGYISGKDRDVTTDGTVLNMIQTDAAINSGNSGGPLFNMKGEVVGITTAKYSGTTTSGATIEGIGFAIPMEDVSDILGDLKNHGYVTGAYLGVMVRDMDSAAGAWYGLPVGAKVESVTSGSCAEKGGVRAGDIIIRLGDYEVGGISDLTRALRKYKAGDEVQVTVLRAGKEQVLTLTLDEKPRETEAPQAPAEYPGQLPDDGSFEDWYNYFFGQDQG